MKFHCTVDRNAAEYGDITTSGVEIILLHNSFYLVNGCITIPSIRGSVNSIRGAIIIISGVVKMPLIPASKAMAVEPFTLCRGNSCS